MRRRPHVSCETRYWRRQHAKHHLFQVHRHRVKGRITARCRILIVENLVFGSIETEDFELSGGAGFADLAGSSR